MSEREDDVTEEATEWGRFRQQSRLTAAEREARREQVRENRRFQRELEAERKEER